MKVWKKAPLLQALAVMANRIYRPSVFHKWRLWLKGKRLHWAVYLTGVTLLMGGILGGVNYQQSFFQVVLVDGKEIGLVRESEEVDEFVDSVIEKCSSLYGMPVAPLQGVRCIREYRPGGEADLGRVKEALRQRLTMVTAALMLTVDSQPVVPVKDEQEIDDVIALLGENYTACCEGEKLLAVQIVEEIEGENCLVRPEELYPAAGVANLLAGGEVGRERDIHIVSRGKTLSDQGWWSRADEREGDDLQIPVPEVHVITTEEVGRVEKIPFSTSYTWTNDLCTVQSRVAVEGEPGSKEVIYHVTRENGRIISSEKVSETVLENPVTRVIERGTARVPAYGTGRFMWPIPYSVDRGGRITQGFRGTAHRGIDIASAAGNSTPILAADSGVVVKVDWGRTQGNYLVLYHGDYYTVYLHNSRHLVSTGDRVAKGQTIAYMGSTGRSTGNHLHFEIRRSDGSGQWRSWGNNPPVNPLNFFSPG